MSLRVPHLRVVVFFSVAVLIVYGGFSIYVVGWTNDAALIGDVIGTWKSFAVAAVAFWIGSSSAGKSKDDLPAPPPNDPDWPTFKDAMK